MKHFLAVLYKDILLFLKGTGCVVFFLPFALIAVFCFFFPEGASYFTESAVQPFPIAIRDEDNTLMSRSLTSQVRDVALFSEVYKVKDETDEALLEQGYAAVTTIPKDFFYEMYTFADCPAIVTLNDAMPFESGLYRAVFTSVMSVVRSDQAAVAGAYRYLYGDLTQELQQQMYAGISNDLFRDLLGRQKFFDDGIEEADVASVTLRRLFATLLSVLMLFYMTTAAKTIPEERRMKIIGRMKAIGGTVLPFAISRFLTALVLLMPATLLSFYLFQPEDKKAYAMVLLVLAVLTFVIIAGIACVARYAQTVQWIGNAWTLLSVVLSGTLFSSRDLPGVLNALRECMLPYQLHRGMTALHYGVPFNEVLRLMRPFCFFALAVVLAVLFVLLARRKRLLERGTNAWRKDSILPLPFFGLTGQKLIYITGAPFGAALLCVLVLTLGLSARYFTQEAAATLTVAVAMEDKTSAAHELVQALQETEGLRVIADGDENNMRSCMISGEAEGVLIIREGYEASLSQKDVEAPLHYESMQSAFSAQAVREMIAGVAGMQRAALRAVAIVEDQKGKLSAEEVNALQETVRECGEELPALAKISTRTGKGIADPMYTGRFSFALFAEILLLFTAASRFSTRDHNRVKRRMRALPFGAARMAFTDALSVYLPGIVITLLLLQWESFFVMALYLLPVCALALLLTGSGMKEGRMDAAAPFAALILSAAGGCFVDISLLPKGISTIGTYLPTGLANALRTGDYGAVWLLLLEGVLLFAVYVMLSSASSERTG